MPRLQPHHIRQIEDLRQRGRSYGTIARILGVDDSSVSYHCTRLGIEHPTRRFEPRAIRSPYMRNGIWVRPFLPFEDEIIERERSKNPPTPWVELGRLLPGRSHSAIIQRAHTLARHQENEHE
jgi:hypothetical protein